MKKEIKNYLSDEESRNKLMAMLDKLDRTKDDFNSDFRVIIFAFETDNKMIDNKTHIISHISEKIDISDLLIAWDLIHDVVEDVLEAEGISKKKLDDEIRHQHTDSYIR